VAPEFGGAGNTSSAEQSANGKGLVAATVATGDFRALVQSTNLDFALPIVAKEECRGGVVAYEMAAARSVAGYDGRSEFG
jgi:hypothetical protein